MRTLRFCFAIAVAVQLGAIPSSAAGAPAPRRETAERKGPGTPLPLQRLQEIVLQSQEVAERAAAGLRQAEARNDALQKLLEQTRREMNELREEVVQLRGSLAGHGPSASASPGVPLVPRAADPAPPAQAATPADSAEMAARLERIEEKVEMNAAQIREQAQTKVETDSRLHLKLFGTLLYNMHYNSADTSENAVPLAAPPTSTRIANGGNNFGSTLRQTSLGFAMNGPRVRGGRLSAAVDFDFYGASQGVYGEDPLGSLRMRTASIRIDGERNSAAMGLMAPMISPLSPTSLASVYYPALGDSGNLWQWVPQATVEHRAAVGESAGLVFQAGILLPFGENYYGKGLEGRPGYESRAAYSKTVGTDQKFEMGLGGYFHPQEFGFGRTVNSYALTGDWMVPLGTNFELSGEAYFGQSITLGLSSGASVSEMFSYVGPLDEPGSTFRGIHSFGGWAQFKASAGQRLEFNAAFGTDDRRNGDVLAGFYRNTSKLRNMSVSFNSIYRVRSNFLLGFEYRRLWTDYPDASRQNGHFNLGVGYLF